MEHLTLVCEIPYEDDGNAYKLRTEQQLLVVINQSHENAKTSSRLTRCTFRESFDDICDSTDKL